MSWHLQLVGPPSVARDGRTLPLPFERRAQLVVLLALRGEWVPRAELAALLWPEAPQALASTNLRKAVFRLREAEWGALVEVEGNALRVAASHDVAAFEAAVAEGRLAEALSIARGELLAGFDDDANPAWADWLRMHRERWRGRWRAVALERLAQEIAPAEGADLASALLQADPFDEAALRALMGHLAARGQSAKAREVYRDFAQRLHDELGLDPGAGLRALHDTLQAQPVALPAPQASIDRFVGRAYEQRRVAELMRRPDCRLVAIVGPGGIGKTRLAQQVLDDLAPLFADGAHLVPLEDLDDAAQLVPRIARTLGVARRGQREGLAALVDQLRSKSLLLVLDNFEPLAAAATPLLDELLQGVPGLKLIVTSRERLASAAQWALPLDGLPCPEPEDADRLQDFDASRLFIAAATRADPGFDANAEREAIVDLCRQVDGLPLALELAAAWTRVMGCGEIARELRHGSELLGAGNAAFPARQASIEAVFEQSWRLLGPREREALSRLSVFRGGFTAEAARSVAGAPLPVLAALLDKSMLSKDGTRLRMHPLLHQFAARRLGEGDTAAARAAHAAHYRWFIDAQRDGLQRGAAAALRAFDEEVENVSLAWHWWCEHGPATALAATAKALSDHAVHRGQPAAALALLQRALQGRQAEQDAALQVRLQALAAHLVYALDRYDEAADTARESLRHAAEGDSTSRRYAHQVIAAVALRQGRLAEAGEHFQATLQLSDATTRAEDRAATVDHLALVEKRMGHWDEALRLSLQALALHRQLDDPAGLALCLNNLASLYLAREEPEAAEAPAREALALCERAGLTATQALALGNLCDAALRCGDWAAAESHGQRSIALCESTGQRLVMAMVQALMVAVATGRGDFEAGRTTLAAAARAALALDAPVLKAAAVMAGARLLRADGRQEAAAGALAVALADTSLGAGDHERMRRQLAQWRPAGAPVQRPALTLAGLLQRLAAEADTAHAALGAFLAG